MQSIKEIFIESVRDYFYPLTWIARKIKKFFS